jgi:formylglycine-generating enzyme required for sulfatase activity
MDAKRRLLLAARALVILGRIHGLDWQEERNRHGAEVMKSRTRVVRTFTAACLVLVGMAGIGCHETKDSSKKVAVEARNTLPRGENLAVGPKRISVDLGGGAKMEMTLIPAGEFMMGSGDSTEATKKLFDQTHGDQGLPAGFWSREHPRHRVRITGAFYIGTYHVTRGQFRRFVEDTGYRTEAEKGEKPGAFGLNAGTGLEDYKKEYCWRHVGFEQTDEHPVVCVTWNDAQAFCAWLSKKESKNYRLPTEAEWEYACRAGTTTRYYCGDDPDTLAQVGNVADATVKAKFPSWNATIKASDGYVFTAPVGKFKPNVFGLYDMHGNVSGWCADWMSEEYYSRSPVDDPTGPESGTARVVRSGSWGTGQDDNRSAYRIGMAPDDRNDETGFRVVRTD